VSELERRLAGLAADYPFPATPDLAGATAAVLAPPRPRLRPLRLAAIAAVVAALALGGALAFSASARGALVDLLELVPGVRIERVDELPEMAFARPDAYGRPVSLAEAARLAPFPLLAPASLGEPDLAYHARDPAGADVVTLVWGDRENGRAVLTTWPAEVILTHKLLGPATGAEVVEVGDDRGLWISGLEHVVFYEGLTGDEHVAEAGLAGNVLVWQDGDIVRRLEAGVTRGRALQLAAELE
jgi:hypothetical protein